jgi:hypothetical protein
VEILSDELINLWVVTRESCNGQVTNLACAEKGALARAFLMVGLDLSVR